MADAGPFEPIVAFAKTDNTTLDAGATAGDDTLDVVATGSFAVGEEVFISTAADEDYQSLGPVLSKVGAPDHTLTMTRGVAINYSAGAKVFSASTSFRWERGPDRRFAPTRDTGVITATSLSGITYTDSVADVVASVAMTFSTGSPDDWAAWESFVVDSRSEGVDSFTLAWWDYSKGTSRVAEVKFAGPLLAPEFTDALSTLCSYAITFIIVVDDTYVTA